MNTFNEIPCDIKIPTCPICDKAIKQKRKPKPRMLYDTEVCRKCYYRFANRRQIAFLLDIISASICFGLLFLFLYAFAVNTSVIAPATTLSFVEILFFSITVTIITIYYGIKDGFAGHSLGKLVCGIQAVNVDTMEPIGLALSLKRNIPIMIAIFVAGMISVHSDALGTIGNLCQGIFFLIIAVKLQYGQRWGDRSAGTKVILKKFSHRPPFDNRGVLCVKCGYNLHGNVSGICPECGTPVGVIQATDDISMQTDSVANAQ